MKRKGRGVIITLKSAHAAVREASWFRIGLMLLLMFSADAWVIQVTVPFFVWAVLLFIRRYFVNGGLLRVRYRKIIYLFLSVSLVGVLIHCTTNLAANLYVVFSDAVLMFLLYGLYAITPHHQVQKEMKILLPLLAYITTAMMLLSYATFLVSKDGFELWGYRLGIIENRFVGIFANANVLAFYAVMAIVFLHIDLRLKGQNGKCPKRFIILNSACMLLHLFSLFLSDSNAALLFITVYLCFVLLFRLLGSLKQMKFRTFVLRFGVWALASVIVVLSTFALRSVSQSTMAYVLSFGTTQEAPPITAEIPENPLPLEEMSYKISSTASTNTNNDTTFKHENTNIDSGRFMLWKQAIALFVRFPLFGIGHQNINLYGDTYLGGLKFSDFHNGYLTILVSSGIIGLAIFIVFALALAKGMMKVVFLTDEDRKDNGILSALLSFFAAYCVYAFFEITILGVISYRIAILWLFLGYAASYLFKYEKTLLKEHPKEKNKYLSD